MTFKFDRPRMACISCVSNLSMNCKDLTFSKIFSNFEEGRVVPLVPFNYLPKRIVLLIKI